MTPLLAVSPWANPDVLVALIGVIGSIIVAIIGKEWYQARKNNPLSAEDVEKAQAVEQAAAVDPMIGEAMTIIEQWKSMVSQINAHHDEQMADVHRRLDAEAGAREILQSEVDALKRESHQQSRTIFSLRTSLSRVEAWYSAISDDWHRIRQMENPPPFPPINVD